MSDFDLAVIGGGINGAGIARDAAGRGLKVLLVEQGDLASATSSASTKLIHGGLRYLEHGWLRLIREALIEREVLLKIAPHLVRPMRFVLPVEPGMRPAWMLRLGLFVYDHLGGRKILPATHTVDLARGPLGAPLRGRYERGFEYSDCSVDDSRLVVLNAVDAKERGAVVRTRTRCMRAERGPVWTLVLDVHGRRDLVRSHALVNATGPWVGLFNEAVLGRPAAQNLRLVAGSHIIVPKLFEHDRGYIFQAPDARVVFALPFEKDFTLIGTTDRAYVGDPTNVSVTAEEIAYLCDIASDRFRARITAADVVWSFAGVRPLFGDAATRPQDTPRDYVLMVDREAGQAPLVTVYGGKITTYRRLAEAVYDELASLFGARPAWTAHEPLPGGDFAVDAFDRVIASARARWPFLSEMQARRLVRAYGTRVEMILGAAKRVDDLGVQFACGLTGAEVDYLMKHEWARSEDDILWRRSKLGLRVSRSERAQLGSYMAGAIGRGCGT